MNARISMKFLVFALALTCLAAVGCRKKPVGITPLPQQGRMGMGEAGQSGIYGGDASGTAGMGAGVSSSENAFPQNAAGHVGWTEDRGMFKTETVYFDYDSSAIKAGEKTKIETVAGYLKGNVSVAVKVEGHCDERGTEEYNRALGERRALAVRQYLIQTGITPERVDTISYGEDKPAAEGHDEMVWKQNRRGEFVILTAPK
jgi:peptidoglycan-associated lipoprotein